MSVQAALAALEGFAGTIPGEVWNDEPTRRRLVAAARLTTLKLESPWDTVQRLSYLPLLLSAARIGQDLDVFRLLADRGDAPAKTEELAAETGADPALLSRILVFLASHWMVEEVAENTYKATNITRNLAIPGIKAGIYHASENCALPYQALPRFLASQNYQNVTDPMKSPFQLGQNTDMHLFHWMLSHPQNFGAFHEYMGTQRIGQPDWLDSFPLDEYCTVGENQDQQKVAFVDIGGGAGHQCDMVIRKFPSLKGRVIVQDRPEVVSLAQIEGVEPMAHDFMVEQPVKGAQAYYLRNIFQDYPTHVCRGILSAIIPALGPDSVILIDDLVLPETGAHWYATQLDLAMMSMLASQERSVKEWTALLEDVGLKMVRMVRYTEHNDSIIVAAPPKSAA